MYGKRMGPPAGRGRNMSAPRGLSVALSKVKNPTARASIQGALDRFGQRPTFPSMPSPVEPAGDSDRVRMLMEWLRRHQRI